MEKAGYVSFGPFPFGQHHTTEDVEALLGDEPLNWVETTHFRIGCAASQLSVARGDADWKRSLKKELKRLRKRLPKVKTTARILDPWLRTHLIAQRLEDCYAEIQRDLGVTDADFPDAPMNANDSPSAYNGRGPYLGMVQKFSVLIVQSEASCARYTRAYGGLESRNPLRLYYSRYGSFCLCLAEETNERQLENDHALHAQLVYNVVVNLLNGYRSYGHDMPPWLPFGLAHWHSRRISPKYPAYDRPIAHRKDDSPFWQWDERALGMLRFKAFESVDDLMLRLDVTKFEMEQHIQSWFLVDYLMHARKKQTMRFLHGLKDPFHGGQYRPERDELLDRQKACFEAAFGMTPAALEAEWKKKTRGLKHRT